MAYQGDPYGDDQYGYADQGQQQYYEQQQQGGGQYDQGPQGGQYDQGQQQQYADQGQGGQQYNDQYGGDEFAYAQARAQQTMQAPAASSRPQSQARMQQQQQQAMYDEYVRQQQQQQQAMYEQQMQQGGGGGGQQGMQQPQISARSASTPTGNAGRAMMQRVEKSHPDFAQPKSSSKWKGTSVHRGTYAPLHNERQPWGTDQDMTKQHGADPYGYRGKRVQISPSKAPGGGYSAPFGTDLMPKDLSRARGKRVTDERITKTREPFGTAEDELNTALSRSRGKRVHEARLQDADAPYARHDNTYKNEAREYVDFKARNESKNRPKDNNVLDPPAYNPRAQGKMPVLGRGPTDSGEQGDIFNPRPLSQQARPRVAPNMNQYNRPTPFATGTTFNSPATPVYY